MDDSADTPAAPAVAATPAAPAAAPKCKLDAHDDAPTAVATKHARADTAAAAFRVKRLSEHARLPVRGSPDAAGYDLFAAHDTAVPARGRAVVPTDISIALPPGTYGRVAPRSGLAVKNFIDVGAGVVDRDYRGQLGVVLFNFGDKDFQVRRGDRIAQIVIERIVTPDVVEVEDLDETQRGAGGFGSTGVSGKPASE